MQIPEGEVIGEGGSRRLTSRWVENDDLEAALVELRTITSRDRLRQSGVDVGFRLEDLHELEVVAADRLLVEKRVRRLAGEHFKLTVRQGPGLRLRGIFFERGEKRFAYVMEDGRLRTEAFELHVVEHCNLRCAHCCNMSPYLDAKTLSVDDIRQQLERLAKVLRADVFKIMGGEPLLHPQITDVLRVIPTTGIAPIVRLFTNGLLLSKMDDAFWSALDHLTISSYASAPVRPEHLAQFAEKARRFDVVLNVKTVDSFSEVMSSVRKEAGDPSVQATYDSCWLRDRCLVSRDGYFFKCTRASYQREAKKKLRISGPDVDADAMWRADGVPMDAPDLDARLHAYMNDATPLNACRQCQGSDGPLVAHTQLRRRDIEEGRI